LDPFCHEGGFTPVAHTQEKSIYMEAKLYVGNLPYSTVDADLQNLFAAAGTVKSAQVIKDRQSGRSKGFGFVEMSSDAEAQNAITMFHGKDYSGRPLTVNIARPREDRPGGGGGGGGFRSGSGRRPGGGDRDRERRNSY
jgi:RNA recognition motif-containing protein